MRFGSRFSVFGSQFWVLVTGYELRVTKWLKASGCNHFCPYETATSLLLLRRVSQGKLFTFAHSEICSFPGEMFSYLKFHPDTVISSLRGRQGRRRISRGKLLPFLKYVEANWNT